MSRQYPNTAGKLSGGEGTNVTFGVGQNGQVRASP
jgi:hypothetical protein